MEEIYTNIYKESRKRAGLEQIEAADLIHVSYSALAKYEARINAVVPREDIVRNMVIAYNDRSFAYKHIKASPLGEFLPDFANSKSLTIATLSFLSDFKAIEGMLTQIIEVTKDGRIDQSESVTWEHFKKHANELISSLQRLMNEEVSDIHVD